MDFSSVNFDLLDNLVSFLEPSFSLLSLGGLDAVAEGFETLVLTTKSLSLSSDDLSPFMAA